MDLSTVIFFSVLAIPALSGLVLPWLMVRQGYREIVGMFLLHYFSSFSCAYCGVSSAKPPISL
ncbi:hypothetical protein [Enterobacter cloacae]|uniref:hypothetical protein n=1 Tax=Enterobacter cloacae TaxID=550 RepID=UPI00388D5501